MTPLLLIHFDRKAWPGAIPGVLLVDTEIFRMGMWLTCTILATTAFPLAQGWRAARHSTLRQSATWAASAWALWLLVYVATALGHDEDARLGRYLALSLTGCAGVAVMGARRPGVGGWNFVVCGLLAVLVLPVVDLLEMKLRRQETLQMVFLGGTLLLGAVNYLPTRAVFAALLAGVGCGLAFAVEVWPGGRASLEVAAGLCLGVAPWAAWTCLGKRHEPREADRVWLSFRDSFGVVWGQRVREQMNRAAANASWPVVLHWHGLQNTGPEPPDEQAVLDTLRALLKRFDNQDQ